VKKIGLLSDTHGIISEQFLNFFADCNEIWHAGDIGSEYVVEKLSAIATFRAVYGNIDGSEIRSQFKENCRFMCEDVDVWITHIGGYPNKYDRKVATEIKLNPPKLFISGHSHILKVINDKKLQLLHINPGAAGNSGFHKVRTAVRFVIEKQTIRDLEILEVPKKND